MKRIIILIVSVLFVIGLSGQSKLYQNLTIEKLTPGFYLNGLNGFIDFYNNGGGKGLGINIPHQTLPFDSLHLNKKEINEIK